MDISNNDEYIWTNSFEPSSPTGQTPSPTSIILPPHDNKPVMIGAIVGSLLGVLVLLGCFFLCKWYKNGQRLKNALPIPGNVKRTEKDIYNHTQVYNQGREVPINNSYYVQQMSTTNNEPVIASVPASHNYGDGMANNERLSKPSIDNLKNEIKQEIMQDLRQEMLQNRNTRDNN